MPFLVSTEQKTTFPWNSELTSDASMRIGPLMHVGIIESSCFEQESPGHTL